jgi:hypothetical protein
MTNANMLKEVVGDILNKTGRKPLKSLRFDIIKPKDLDQYIARLCVYVAPSYLPFATYDGGMIVFHLWPGRSIENSPILYISTDDQQAEFMCDKLSNLPSVLWLWVNSYFKQKSEVLHQATDQIAASIPRGQPVPQALWGLFEYELNRWAGDGDDYTNQAWVVAGVDHPFAGGPMLSFIMENDEALPRLEPFVVTRPDVPELVSALLATRAKAGLSCQAEEVLKVLYAEAWRQLDCIYDGMWRKRGKGICEWDCTLSNLENPEAVLGNTSLKALIGHPNTYSGEDQEGSNTLLTVAKAFQDQGDNEAALRQLRNAATVSILTSGEYDDELANKIAETCDAIAPDSLAAAVARESVRVRKQGP